MLRFYGSLCNVKRFYCSRTFLIQVLQCRHPIATVEGQSLRSGCLIHNGTYLTLSLTLTLTYTNPNRYSKGNPNPTNPTNPNTTYYAPTSQGLPVEVHFSSTEIGNY